MVAAVRNARGSPDHECMYKMSCTVRAGMMLTSALLDPTLAWFFAGLVPGCRAALRTILVH
jgi:hypothetical protein